MVKYGKWLKISFIIVFAFFLIYFIHYTFIYTSTYKEIGETRIEIEKGNANNFIDDTLASVRLGIKAKKLDPLTLQNVSVCQNFSIRGLKNIKRFGQANVYGRADDGYDVIVTIGFKRLTASCQVKIGWWLLEVTGSLKANISNLNIYGDISIPKTKKSHPILNSFQVVQQEHFNMTFEGNNWAGKATEWLFPLFKVLLKHRLNSVLNDDVPSLIQSNLNDFEIPKDYFKTVKFPANVEPRPTQQVET